MSYCKKFRAAFALGVFVVLSASYPAHGAEQDWRSSSEALAGRIQALIDDLTRRMNDVSAPPAVSLDRNAGEMDEMIASQRRVRLLEMRQREAQIISDMITNLARAREQLSARSDGGDGAPAPVSPSVPERQTQAEYRIMSVSGTGDALRAVVWSERTGRISVAAGTRLPDGTVVSRVEVDGIWVRRPGDSQEIPLGQAESAPSSAMMGGGLPVVTIPPSSVPAGSIPRPSMPPGMPSVPPSSAPTRQSPSQPPAPVGIGGVPPPPAPASGRTPTGSSAGPGQR